MKINEVPYMYAILDTNTNDVIFSARGGCYKNKEALSVKLEKLIRKNGNHYKPILYALVGSNL